MTYKEVEMDGNSEFIKQTMDKTSSEYWDEFWKTNSIPNEIVVNKKSINGYLYTEFDAFFKKHLTADNQKSIIELGCGNSVWLPYFYKNFNFSIYGLDYAKLGCERTRQILTSYNTPGTVIEGDLFSPSAELKDAFDYVVSFGVIEHFEDTTHVLKAHKTYLKKDGKIIVSIPNMRGFPGWYQRMMNREVFDTHVPLSREALMAALQDAGFKNIDAQYVLPVAVSAQIEGGTKQKHVKVKRTLTLTLSRLAKVVWAVEIFTGIKFPRSKWLSPAIIAYAER